MKKIIFIVGDGIGNQVQTIPALVYLKKKYGYFVTVYNTMPTTKKPTKILFEHIADEIVIRGEPINKPIYAGQFITSRGWDKPLKHVKILNSRHCKNITKVSEIEYNLSIVDTGYTNEDFSIDEDLYSHVQTSIDVPDIIVHNGYSKVSSAARRRWECKSYSRYKELCRKLLSRGFSVGSIGSKDEYVPGTLNLTGLNLRDSMGVIKGSKLLISNDTSTYHIANILCKNNIAIYTMTNPGKNYDQRFHKFTSIIRKKMSCSPCQKKAPDFWLYNKKQCGWRCRDIKPDIIVNKAIEIIS
jgi:ADP-heptose:LPS heptosyltransferase